jgi:serine/threonine protein phosphatase 1
MLDGLFVIVVAELMLLVSIAAMSLRARRMDVLTCISNETHWTVRLGIDEHRWPDERTQRRLKQAPLQDPEETIAGSTPLRLSLHLGDPDGQAKSASPAPNWAGGTQNQSIRRSPVPAALPRGVRIYAVGDIHGRSDLLAHLLRGIETHCRRKPVDQAITVFLGDYIDRGPGSRGVLDLLVQWRRDNKAVFLRGNHETFVQRFLADSRTLDEWRQCGGLETLVSYGLKPSINADRHEQARLAGELAHALPKQHLDFLESLDLSFSCGDFLFVHAGIRPGVPIKEQTEDDLLWIRDEFLVYEQPFERFVVHGHTPVSVPDLRSNRINIDTGAFATGRLTCIVIEGSGIAQLRFTDSEGARLSVP